MERINIKDTLKYIMIWMGIFCIAIYVYAWWTFPGIFHMETIIDTKNFLTGGMHGIQDMLQKIFNLTMIEGGFYRPRVGAFVIQYLDIKAWIVLNKLFPGWGGITYLFFLESHLL